MSKGTTSSVVEDPFEAAIRIQEEQQREAEEAKNKPKGFTPFNYEQVQVLCLHDKRPNAPKEQETVFRVIGLPVEVRQNPWDMKLIFRSEVVNDKGKKMRITWKQKHDYAGKDTGVIDPDWILNQLYEAVMEKTWNKDAVDKDGKPIVSKKGNVGAYVFTHKGKPSYERIANNVIGNFQSSFLPSKNGLYEINVISRMDDWCAENKHTMLLGRALTSDAEGKLYSTEGITSDLYKDLSQSVMKVHRHYDIDVIVQKTMTVDGDKLVPKYDVMDATVPAAKIKPATKKLFTKPAVDEDGRAMKTPLTDEEKAYKVYNLDALCAPTSYTKIKKGLSDLFAQADEDLGTRFSETLNMLAEKEAEERKVSGSAGFKVSMYMSKELNDADTSVATVTEEDDSAPF